MSSGILAQIYNLCLHCPYLYIVDFAPFLSLSISFSFAGHIIIAIRDYQHYFMMYVYKAFIDISEVDLQGNKKRTKKIGY